MKVYLYDIDKIYSGEYEAQESPMEPGVFIIPSYSTQLPPPATNANQVAVFKNNNWEVIPDYRGEIWYDKVSGEGVIIESIGIPPENLQQQPLPPSSQEMWVELQDQASTELGESDIIVIRCYEKGMAVPQEWIDYREELRVIKRTESGDPSLGLPVKPESPDFS